MIQIPANVPDYELDFYLGSFKVCNKMVREDGIAIVEAVALTLKKYGAIVSDVGQLEQFLYQEVTAYTEPAVSIIAENLDDKGWWTDLLHTEDFHAEYWTRYYNYLRRKPAWSLPAIIDIDTSTDDVMNCIANPHAPNCLVRMGMVFGYVQSGKTAHYLGLINKAFDAGYRIIIVLQMLIYYIDI